MGNKKEITKDSVITPEVVIELGFRKSCNLYLKTGMSVGRSHGTWVASYKFEPIKDVFRVGQLLEYMEKYGVSNELGVTSK